MLTLEERTDAEAATVLGLAADEPLIFLERVRLLDDEPIAVDCSWLPASFARPLLEVDFARTSLYGELRVPLRRQPVPRLGAHRAEAAPPMSSASCSGSVPTWSCSRSSGWPSDDRRALEWRHSVVRGDRYSFVARWSGTGVATGMEPADG